MGADPVVRQDPDNHVGVGGDWVGVSHPVLPCVYHVGYCRLRCLVLGADVFETSFKHLVEANILSLLRFRF